MSFISSHKQSGIGQYSVSETAQVGNPSCAVILKSYDINVRDPRNTSSFSGVSAILSR